MRAPGARSSRSAMRLASPRTVPRMTISPAATRAPWSTVPLISTRLPVAATPPVIRAASDTSTSEPAASRSPSIVVSTVSIWPTMRVESPIGPRRSIVLPAANTSPSTWPSTTTRRAPTTRSPLSRPSTLTASPAA